MKALLKAARKSQLTVGAAVGPVVGQVPPGLPAGGRAARRGPRRSCLARPAGRRARRPRPPAAPGRCRAGGRPAARPRRSQPRCPACKAQAGTGRSTGRRRTTTGSTHGRARRKAGPPIPRRPARASRRADTAASPPRSTARRPAAAIDEVAVADTRPAGADEQHVRAVDQLIERNQVCRTRRVRRDGALAAVPHRQSRLAREGNRCWRVDLDHVGAEVGEQHPGDGARHAAGEVKHAHAASAGASSLPARNLRYCPISEHLPVPRRQRKRPRGTKGGFCRVTFAEIVLDCRVRGDGLTRQGGFCMRIGLTGGGTTADRIVSQASRAEADGFTSMLVPELGRRRRPARGHDAGRARHLGHRARHRRACYLCLSSRAPGQPRQRHRVRHRRARPAHPRRRPVSPRGLRHQPARPAV